MPSPPPASSRAAALPAERRAPSAAPSLMAPLRRVIALSAVAGYVEVIGYTDFGGIYPAIMTGNTVQLGLTFAKSQWSRFALIGFAVGVFFAGCMIASLIKQRLRRPPLELMLMAAVLAGAAAVRTHPALRIPVELPLLAMGLAMQGETVAQFGGASLQTIVVTNNMVKFSDALVALCLPSRLATKSPTPLGKRLADMLLPGSAWLSYSVAAAAGAVAMGWTPYALLAPAALLLLITLDLVGGSPAP